MAMADSAAQKGFFTGQYLIFTKNEGLTRDCIVVERKRNADETNANGCYDVIQSIILPSNKANTVSRPFNTLWSGPSPGLSRV
jgi:hypothetical protein